MREAHKSQTQGCLKMQSKVHSDCKCCSKSELSNSVMFAKAPIHLVSSTCSLPCSRSNSIASGFSDADSNSEDEKLAILRKKSIDVSKLLPPIGVFWDIENCHVPKGKSATAIAQAIRDKFFVGYREADFIVVCDVTKEKSRIIQELNDAQVNLIHVAATCKNAADEKLRQSIRRFADTHSAPAAIILISGDVNFAGDLNDLRHRKKIHVILVHNVNVSKALVLCASEHYSFSNLVENIPSRDPFQNENTTYEILVSNLPEEREPIKVKSRLRHLCENIGGRIGFVSKTMCSIRFPAIEFAIRARKRMDGEDVFGNKIVVTGPIQSDDWDCNWRRNKKTHTKDDLDIVPAMNRRAKDENTFHFNDFYSHKPLANMDSNLSYSQNLDSSIQQQFTKNMAPFFPNNIVGNFNFPKVPNIENLKVIQNSNCHPQKSYFNNMEAESGGGVDSDQKKNAVDNRKCNNNILTNRLDGLNRLNNSATNGDAGMHSVENNQLLLAQAQQLHMFAQNAFAQKNLSQSILAQQMVSNPMNRNNGEAGSSGRFIRGTHGDNNFQTNVGNRNLMYGEEDCESFNSFDPYFEPIQKPNHECSSPVDLHVSGLDPYMDLIVAKNVLTSVFQNHVEVLSVSVFCLSDGSVVASVKVPSFQDAQYAISKLQRRKIGVRRITIAFQNNSRYQRQLIRSQVAQLLSEMPQNKIPLFRFTEMFKSRFLNSVNFSELNKMKDICTITEEESGRMISANSIYQINALTKLEKKESSAPYCQNHSHKTLSDSELPVLPSVNISLKVLSSRIKSLLESHAGKLFLPSLADCYQARFGPLPADPAGVPLEHLVSCISGIEVSQGHGEFKYITWSQATQSNDEHVKCVSPMLIGTTSVFTKELLDLLKDTPKCLLPFSQFIPSYHRRYRRQCRVSDYGYTKLLDLLESLPHILQVIRNGTQKVITLSHKAQVRRFTTDLLRVLKNQASRQIDLKDFPAQYEKIMERPWDPCYYGLCELDDLLSCVPQTAIQIETKQDGTTIVSVPKREQTPEEIELTKKFAQEVVELLKRVPGCSMEFNKFVPAYHNQFGRQCRVSSYGCFKLIELFESIPDTVSIQEDSSRGEKYLVLTTPKKLKVFAEMVCQILSGEGGVMLLFRLELAYQFYQYESIVAPCDIECETFEEVLNKIPEHVKIEDSRKGRLVILKNEINSMVLTRRVRFILLNHEKLPISQFNKAYTQQYQQKIDLETDINKISEAVKLVKKGNETFVQLTPLSIFANQMYILLSEHKGGIPLVNFESAYLNKFKKPCLPTQFGFPTLSSLLSAIPETVTVQSSGYYTHKRLIELNTDLKSADFRQANFNNGNSSQKEPGSMGCTKKPPRFYDLWQSDSLFPCWNDLNGLPDYIKAPHPSELPLPSAKLSTPVQKLHSESGLRNEVEATSTTDENIPEVTEAEICRSNHADENFTKRMNRIAAHFGNLN